MLRRRTVALSYIGTVESQIEIEKSVKMGFVDLVEVIFFQHAVEGATAYSQYFCGFWNMSFCIF